MAKAGKPNPAMMGNPELLAMMMGGWTPEASWWEDTWKDSKWESGSDDKAKWESGSDKASSSEEKGSSGGKGGFAKGGGIKGNYLPGKGSLTPRPGDWYCSECGDLQFARNSTCRRCGNASPHGDTPGNGQPMLPGDWTCPACNDLVFARNDNCRRCGFKKPDDVETVPKGEGKGAKSGFNSPYPHYARPGDWYCPSCGDLQFAKNMECRKCGEARPEDVEVEASMPGDWICPNCGDLQFARNEECRRCATPKPEGSDLPGSSTKAKGKGWGKAAKGIQWDMGKAKAMMMKGKAKGYW